MIAFSYNKDIKDFRLFTSNCSHETMNHMKQNIKAHGKDEIIIELTDDSAKQLIKFLRRCVNE